MRIHRRFKAKFSVVLTSHGKQRQLGPALHTAWQHSGSKVASIRRLHVQSSTLRSGDYEKTSGLVGVFFEATWSHMRSRRTHNSSHARPVHSNAILWVDRPMDSNGDFGWHVIGTSWVIIPWKYGKSKKEIIIPTLRALSSDKSGYFLLT